MFIFTTLWDNGSLGVPAAFPPFSQQWRLSSKDMKRTLSTESGTSLRESTGGLMVNSLRQLRLRSGLSSETLDQSRLSVKL